MSLLRIEKSLGVGRLKLDVMRIHEMNLGEAVDYLIREVGVRPLMAVPAATPTISSQ
jgi:hypothetical protein